LDYKESYWQASKAVLRTLSSSNPLDRNNAINLTGQLAAEQVVQLQKLRELQPEDMTGKAAYQGYVTQQQAASEAATQQFFSYTPEVSDGRTFQGGWK
jgi:P-type conjugative transfer protein TrbJ